MKSARRVSGMCLLNKAYEQKAALVQRGLVRVKL